MDAGAVAGAWSALLDGQPVGPDDGFFFELGGHSLLGVAIVSSLAASTGLPLELRDLYLAPTPREFAAYLGELRARLAELRARVPAGADWDLRVFAAALAELGAAAADSLLPAAVGLRFEPPAGDPVLAATAGAARIGLLRQARGQGSCELVTGAGDEVQVRRQDALLRLTLAAGPGGPVVRISARP